ncbi:MAG: hypothetical protein HY721_16705 [Planctomycetes bacterium]|nr:hypothetical protein [Planctomycetota bacterium]
MLTGAASWTPRTTLAAGSLLAVLVGANFAFDWLRRFEFEETRSALALSRHQLHEEVAKDLAAARVMQASIQDRLSEVDRILKEVQGCFHGAAQAAPEGREAEPTVRAAGEAQEDGDAPEESGPRVFAVSVAAMEEMFEDFGSDSFLLNNYTDVTDPALWKPEELVALGEREFGATLDEVGRRKLVFEIEALRQACHAAFSHFQALKTEGILERLESGDYDEADAFGNYPRLDLPPGEVFASTLVGPGRFAWERSKHPEMYRWNCLYKFIPLAMLERVRAAFKEGRSP